MSLMLDENRDGALTNVREHFTLSRSLEYFNDAELIRQCGHPRSDWPLVILKEGLDNGLDGCESAGVAPEITISVDDTVLVIRDNGCGIPPDVVGRICDFTSRTSDKAAYVSPSRGAMGNGAKLILALPFALNQQRPTTVVIEACGTRHTIKVDIDEVRREPMVGRSEQQIVKTNGTTLRIPADSACSLEAYRSPEFLQLIQNFALFNPHATITVDHFGQHWSSPATVPMQKWTPADPTSPHWYDRESFGNLVRNKIAADRTAGRDRTIREVIGTFRGLSGSTKPPRVITAAGLKGDYLKQLLDGEQKLRQDAVAALLTAMKEASAPVKPEALGVLGDGHFRTQLSTGGDATFRYKRICGEASGRPFVVEAAFTSKTIHTGLTIGINSSVPLHNPLQQTAIGEEWGLEALLNELRVDFDTQPTEECQYDDEDEDDGDEDEGDDDSDSRDRPCLALHLCFPGFSFTDQGKAALHLPEDLGRAVGLAVTDVTKQWTKYQKLLERSAAAADRMEARTERSLRKADFITQKEAADQVIEGAYFHARGPVPASVRPRQIMYASRKRIEELSGKPLTGQYFSQTLLTYFMKGHPELTKDWDIVWDDRGHFEEPHDGIRIGVGTASVREYIENRNSHSYGAILYIEKEGFDETFKAYHLPERYDLAVMSSKGMSTTAARTLIEKCSRQGVKILCLHDFDVAGFTICATASRDTERYEFEHTPDVIDIGLRLADVREMGLLSEGVEIRDDPSDRLIRDGATPEEIEFLRGTRTIISKGKVGFKGQRVELNAMTNPELIAFVERKLEKHGVRKVIPPEDLLQRNFRAAVRQQKIEGHMTAVQEMVSKEMEQFKPPRDLHRKVANELERHSAFSWRRAIDTLATAKGNRDD